jgi:hypothetical protein
VHLTAPAFRALTARVTISPDKVASYQLASQYGFAEVGQQWDDEDGLEIIDEVDAQHLQTRPPSAHAAMSAHRTCGTTQNRASCTARSIRQRRCRRVQSRRSARLRGEGDRSVVTTGDGRRDGSAAGVVGLSAADRSAARVAPESWHPA